MELALVDIECLPLVTDELEMKDRLEALTRLVRLLAAFEEEDDDKRWFASAISHCIHFLAWLTAINIVKYRFAPTF